MELVPLIKKLYSLTTEIQNIFNKNLFIYCVIERSRGVWEMFQTVLNTHIKSKSIQYGIFKEKEDKEGCCLLRREPLSSSFRSASLSHALAPGMYLTIEAGNSSTSHKSESSITRVSQWLCCRAGKNSYPQEAVAPLGSSAAATWHNSRKLQAAEPRLKLAG